MKTIYFDFLIRIRQKLRVEDVFFIGQKVSKLPTKTENPLLLVSFVYFIFLMSINAFTVNNNKSNEKNFTLIKINGKLFIVCEKDIMFGL